MAGQVGLRISIDVGQAKAQTEDLGRSIDDLRSKIKELEAAGDWKGAAQLYTALNNATSARGQIMQQARQSDLVQQNMQKQQQLRNDPFGGMSAWVFQQAATQITQGIISAVNTTMSAAKMRASGDYTGAAVAYERGIGEMAGGLGGTAAGVGLGALISAITGLPPQITIPITSQIASSFGQLLGGMSAREKEEALAYSQQYKGALPSIDLLNQYYGGAINQKTLKENNDYGLEMYGRAAKAADGTGLSTEGFIEAMKQMGGHGIRSETQALNMAQTQALWSRFTGTDISTILKYAGHSYRYGGETGATATAYGGLQAQNMGKGQFSEFLNSMQRIMEEGIAKGFVKSTSEIAGNMAMLYKLSGNSPLWQGEQGARRLSQMNNAIANATNLQSVEDIISFGVVRDIWDKHDKSGWMPGEQRKGITYTGTYADYMQLLERGIDPEFMEGQWKAVQGLEGGNIVGMIERFKNMYGLNYNGAAQVWAMFDDAWDKDNDTWKAGKSPQQLAADIEKMKEDPKVLSDSALLQKTLNDLSTNGIKIGKFTFDSTEIVLLRQEAEKLVGILRGKQTGSSMAAAGERLGEILYSDETIDSINSTINPYGGGAGLNFMFNMADLIKAENKTTGHLWWKEDDANAQEIGRQFNNDIVPYLPEKPSENILRLLNELGTVYQDSTKRSSESGTKVGTDEFSELTEIINKLKSEIHTLGGTIEDLKKEGIGIHGSIEASYE
ncbi:MAG: hypothetical protein LBH43_07955 [Treponema sp.]|jgi:hypothetical protein|nr:hypothetical protein [Treponema sp.]